MTFSAHRLLPWFAVLALALAVAPARGQFSGANGLIAPTVFPSPYLGYGGYPFGGFSPFGGYGTQWMQNPYEGYLNGAANVTTANAQYQLTIQQARLAREQARRSALQTRRAALEEYAYERSLMPDPEKIRQQQLMKSLERSRHNPPLIDVWSGTALNDLLRDIQNAQSRGVEAGDVSIAPDVLKHVNVTTGKTYGGVGLLRNNGKLNWPAALRQSTYSDERKRLDELLPKAVEQARSGQVDVDVLNGINKTLKELERALDAGVSGDMPPDEYIQGSRYLRQLKDSARLLQQDDVAKYFRTEWTPQGSTVAALVQQMTKQGLRFAPAVSGDESYYTALHSALVEYDLSLANMTTAPSLSTAP